MSFYLGNSPLTLDPMQTPIHAEIAPALTGYADLSKVSEIDLEKAVEEFRLQNLIFRAARKLYLQSADSFSGDKQYLAVQLIKIVEKFLASEKLDVPSLWHQDPIRKRILIAMNMDTVVGHVNRSVFPQNMEKMDVLFDEEQPIGSTAFMRNWYTTKPCFPTEKSQISHVLYDSTWEKAVADLCERDPHVGSWAKNDHLNFKIRYLYRGASRNFIPDYLIRFASGKTLVLEVKGQDSEQNRAKRAAMQTWVEAVNEKGGFGQWCFDVVFEPAKIRDVVMRHANKEFDDFFNSGLVRGAPEEAEELVDSFDRETFDSSSESCAAAPEKDDFIVLSESKSEILQYSDDLDFETIDETVELAAIDDKDEQELLLKDPRNVPVWFGTNRAPVDIDNVLKGFSDVWSDETTLGRCVVNIPKGHVPGSLGSSWWVKLFKGDDKLTVLSIDSIPKETFWGGLATVMSEPNDDEFKREALFFLHGYNVTFDQAALRTAQLAYDLRIKPAAFFSWPSGGDVDDYMADESAIEASYEAVSEFISQLDQCALSTGTILHVVAHSMGNRALLHALEAVAQGVVGGDGSAIDNLVFAAPDVDARVFMQKLKKINSIGHSKTLYTSPKDKAVWFSKTLHKFARAGLIPPVTIAPGLDTIDASGVDDTFLGHSYIGSVRALLHDLSSLLKAGLPPSQRVGLEPAINEDGQKYWRIK